MDERIMTYKAFSEQVENQIPKMMGNKVSVEITERKDEYAQTSEWLIVKNKEYPEIPEVALSLESAYENYKKTVDPEKVIKVMQLTVSKKFEMALEKVNQMLSTGNIDTEKLYVKVISEDIAKREKENGIYVEENSGQFHEYFLYTESNEEKAIPEEKIKETKIELEMLRMIANKNIEKLFPLEIDEIHGNSAYGIPSTYLVSKEPGTTWEMYGKSYQNNLSDKIKQNYLIYSLDADTHMIVPADIPRIMEEAEDILGQMDQYGYGMHMEICGLYIDEERKIITDKEKMKEVVEENRKRSSLLRR